MEMKNKAYMLLVITLFSGALLPILLATVAHANLYEFFLMLYAVSLPVSIVFLAARGKLGELKGVLKDKRMIALLCFTGIVTYLPIEFGIAFAEHYVSAALTTAIFRMSPLLMLMLLPTLLHEKLSKYQIAALSLAFIGIYIGISGGSLLGIFQNADVGIIIFLMIMALAYALSFILIKKYVVDVGVLITVASATMLLIFLGLFFATGAVAQSFSALQLGVLVYVGAFFNVISFFLYLTALRPIKASIVANVYFFSPFISFVFAYLLLGEAIQPYYIAIALLPGIGLLLQRFDKQGGKYISRNSQSNIRHMTIFDVTGVFANTGEVAINNTIREGGRILAVNLDNEHSAHVDGMISANASGIYTDSHQSIQAESRFVKDILGTNKGEFVVMKAGRLKECEDFFEKLYDRISGNVEQ